MNRCSLCKIQESVQKPTNFEIPYRGFTLKGTAYKGGCVVCARQDIQELLNDYGKELLKEGKRVDWIAYAGAYENAHNDDGESFSRMTVVLIRAEVLSRDCENRWTIKDGVNPYDPYSGGTLYFSRKEDAMAFAVLLSANIRSDWRLQQFGEAISKETVLAARKKIFERACAESESPSDNSTTPAA